METRQLEHEGFEHTDEFRVPVAGEYYQATGDGKAVSHTAEDVVLNFGDKGGKRWILRKKEWANKKLVAVHPAWRPGFEIALEEIKNNAEKLLKEIRSYQ